MNEKSSVVGGWHDVGDRILAVRICNRQRYEHVDKLNWGIPEMSRRHSWGRSKDSENIISVESWLQRKVRGIWERGLQFVAVAW